MIDDAITQRLEIARRELLDLTGRNRLLNTQRRSTRSSRLEIVDEISQEVFRHLVVEGKSMSFLPAREVVTEAASEEDEPDSRIDTDSAIQSDSSAEAATQSVGQQNVNDQPDDESAPVGVTSDEQIDQTDSAFGTLVEPDDAENALPQPDDDELDARHTDNKLQTPLTSEKLQKRLLKMFYDARTFEEEQGVNILFLAVGFLKWKEPGKDGKERFAPLILVPVSLSRSSARAKFRIRYDEEEVVTNLSLQEKLKVDFDLQLPTISEDEDWTPHDYLAQVESVIEGIEGWEVLRNDMVMWFFSFSKFLMYRDLQSENWPVKNPIEQHPLIRSLLTTGFQPQPAICKEGAHLDELLDPLTTIHVTDADSSQSIAIEEVRQGRNLVIQGPPGTGKSQTITNLIGAAVKDGRKVLFVAEKMAALDVVKRRLDSLGIGITSLELHSHKASKRAVLRELGETLRLGRPMVGDVQGLVDELRTVRNELNQHAQSMCSELEPSSVTPFQAIGELVRIRQRELPHPEFDLTHAREWTPKDLKARHAALQNVVDQMENVGNPRLHPWRGVGIGTILPSDQGRIKTAATELADSLKAAISANSILAATLQGTSETVNQVEALTRFANMIGEMPELSTECLLDSAWSDQRDQISELVQQGRTLQNSREKLEGVFADLAWTIDVREARLAINAHGRSFFLFRIFNGAYRRAMSTFKGLLTCPNPRSVEERVAFLDFLIAGQNAEKQIEQDEERDRVGHRAFGQLWRGVSSDYQSLQAICDWESACATSAKEINAMEGATLDHRSIAAQVEDRADLVQRGQHVRDLSEAWQKQFAQLTELLSLDLDQAFETSLAETRFSDLLAKLTAWIDQTESITHWIDYRRRYEDLGEISLAGIAQEIHSGNIPADQVIDQFELKYYDEMTRVAFDRFPHLAEFNGTTHEKLLENFSQLDRERMLIARREVARVHYDGMPTNAANIGQVGVVRREIQKKRRHLSLRRLLRDAGRAVQAIKPVFMMSPTSIAQFLEPGRLQFDLLVIDEASQVTPVDAFGAIARSKQIIVVGDDKQLPPTRFFQRVADDSSEAESHYEFNAGSMESVLSLCAAQNVTQRMLRWHYRSRHHSLIAVSNQEFYNKQLYVIPSPEKNSPELGLKLRFIENGIFDRGGTATNHIEATAIVDAVLHHAQEFPNRSLGVGTFSVSQRDAVLDELERRRREHPEFESFFTTDSYEPFFVKNLENIQGDERDVIFISIGYAKDDKGKLTMNFGPLTNEGGERRLNVLITRARSRCEVFSSIRASEIDLNRTNARGTKSLKVFLEHAERNTSGLISDDDESITSDYSEPFETQIAYQLAQQGYVVEQHVGTTGLYVDVALEDSKEADRFFMGIECDGPDYQSARTARDRDRIRFDVLKRQGWHIERVWSIDWLHRPEEQLQRLTTAATNLNPRDQKSDDEATASTTVDSESLSNDSTQDSGRASATSKPTDTESANRGDSIDRADHAPDFENPCGVTDYQLADFTIDKSENKSDSVHELPDDVIQSTICRIVEIEGPVHLDEIARRVASAGGLKRMSSRVTQTVETQVDQLVTRAALVRDFEFLTIPNQRISVRNRTTAIHLRKPELIALSEIHAGVLAIVETHFGASRDDAIVETGRLFGFSATSPQLRDRIDGEITTMLANGALVELDGWLHAGAEAVSDFGLSPESVN